MSSIDQSPKKLTRADIDHEISLLIKEASDGYLVHCGSEELQPQFGDTVYDAIANYAEHARQENRADQTEVEMQ